MTDEPEPASGKSPTSEGPVPPYKNPPFWIAFRVAVVVLPLAGLTALNVVAAASRFARAVSGRAGDFVPMLLYLAVAAVAGRQTWRSVRRIRLMRLGLEPVEATGLLMNLGAFVVFLSLVAALASRLSSELFRNGIEKSTQGNLGAIRGALSIYYGDMEGAYPADLRSLTIAGKYLTTMPKAVLPKHHRSSAKVLNSRTPDDTGGWVYNDAPTDANVGKVTVNCTHTDVKGAVWDSY